MSPIDPIKPVALDWWSGIPFWIGLASAAGAAFAKYGPMALDMYLKFSADRREHKRLEQQPAKPAALPEAADEPPTQREPAAERPASPPRAPAHSLSEVPSRAELDARLADLRSEVLREVAEERAEREKLAERLDRLGRAFERLKATVLRGIKDFAERLAKLEGWLDGWINGGGPGSRRR